MQKVITSIWLQKDSTEAFNFYKEVFKDVKEHRKLELHHGSEYETTIRFMSIKNFTFMLMGNGPFELTEAISLAYLVNPFLNRNARSEIEDIYKKLVVGAKKIIQPLELEHPKAWIIDKFGLSWCIGYSSKIHKETLVMPYLVFTGKHHGFAKDAINYYQEIFPQFDLMQSFENKEEKTFISQIKLFKEPLLIGDDSFTKHFTEAFSLMVICEDQAEINSYWHKLSSFKESENCGWLKDKYG
ncbi:VOC family protein [Acholeplasma hippikon]|uniref:3-demethylubiquinone-9 3-methyltransferase n=1 Tax=Acholeplasma hippikon TaxID=264636 RepID=A0A449BI03_9MOLU|nr:VOC family protein [Acholeplasma hippikon]VEU82075.1 3-demethylubiquinone-9 3-methyltransferase [Acholeplasma hippikon]